MCAQNSLFFSNRRYRLLRHLGSGGMGEVYKAYDRLTQQVVAIKRLHLSQQRLYADEASGLRKLTNEFAILAGLHHPNIICVQGYGFEHRTQPFVVLDYLEDAVDLVMASRQLDFDGKVDLFIQILQALVYLHRHHIVHRDLKPTNVLVTPQYEIRLVDFGLAGDPIPDLIDTAIGSLAYMSPEALNHQPIGIPADLNAVGVLAYECFTGTHPYMSGTVSRTMSNILNAAPDVERLMQALDGNHALAQVILFLLRKRPSERYASAQQVLVDLCQAVGRPLPEETQIIREGYLQSALFIGREKELGILRDALDNAIDGQGSGWLVGGDSGVGKSRLLQQIRTHALIEGFMVVRGSAIEEGSLTYQLWRGVVPQLLVDELSPPTHELALLREIVPDIDLLLEVSLDVSGGELHASAFEALMVDLLGRRDQPILVLLEDLHWARDQWAVLDNIMAAVQSLPVVFIATFGTHDAPDLPQHIPTAQPLYLSRFSRDEIGQLITSILGQRDFVPQLVEMLHRETDGNVFYLLDIVRSLAEQAGGLEHITASMINTTTIVTPSIREMIQRRLGLLTTDHLPMLRLAALAGRQLDFNILRYVDSEMDYDRWLSDCAEASILEYDSGEWRFIHDKVRQGMLYRVDERVKARMHRMIAEAIEAVYWNQPGYELRLAEQWRGAGELEREMQYLLLHMEWLLNVRRFEEVQAHLEPYLLRFDEAAVSDPTVEVYRAEILLLLGRAALGINDLRTGSEYVNAARALATNLASPVFRLRCDAIRVRIHLYRGEYADAAPILDDALALVGKLHEPRLTAELLCQEAMLLARTHVYDEAERSLERASAIYGELHDVKGLAESANLMGQIAAEVGQMPHAIQSFEQAYHLFRENQNFAEMVRPLNNLGVLMCRIRRYDESVAYLKRALEGAQRYGYPIIVSASLRNLGRTYVEMGELDAALECFNELLPLSRAPGLKRQLFTISMEMALIHLQAGRMAYAQMMAWQAFSLTIDRFDDELLGWVVWYGANFALAQNHLIESITMTGCLLKHLDQIDRSLENSIRAFRQHLETLSDPTFIANTLARSGHSLEACARVVSESHLHTDID